MSTFLSLQPARHTKLEKADILEMTVKHLQSVQRQQLNMAIQSDPSVIHKFKTGFVECAEEVTRYINQLDNIDPAVRQGLASHLHKCANSLDQIGSMTNFNNGYCGNMPTLNPLAAATMSATTSTLFPTMPHDLNNNHNTVPVAPIQMGGVQLIPSRLPSGELALIVPNANTSNATPPFAVWPPPIAQMPTQLHAPAVAHNTKVPTVAEITANHQQNLSAFTKPITMAQQQQQQQQQQQTSKMHANIVLPQKPTPKQHVSPQPKLYQPTPTNNYAHNSSTTTSPPLSPISSNSSHGDESSLLQTSSEYVPSQHITDVFNTPPSSANSSLSSANSSTHLQQQQVTSTSGRNLLNSRKRSLNSTDSADSFDEPSVKKFVTRNDISTDEEGACWRPW